MSSNMALAIVVNIIVGFAIALQIKLGVLAHISTFRL
jgi:hypothetical protein